MNNRIFFVKKQSFERDTSSQIIGWNNIIQMTDRDLQYFVLNRLFPPEVISRDFLLYLNYKYAKEINYIINYICNHVSHSKHNPAKERDMEDAFKEALVKGNIDVEAMRTLNKDDFLNWEMVETSDVLESFNTKKR